MNSIQFGNSVIKYKVKRSNRKTTEIIVSKKGIEVLTPSKKSSNEILNIVNAHSRWIYQKKLRAKEERNHKLTYQNGSNLPFLGKYYSLIVNKSLNSKEFTFSNNKFNVSFESRTKIKKAYLEWSKTKAIPIFEDYVQKCSRNLGVQNKKILVKNMKTKWGNVSRNGTITLNQNLIRAPKEIVQYVIAHEVCHLKIPNHSKAYWELLKMVMPHYDQRKEWLRVNRTLLM